MLLLSFLRSVWVRPDGRNVLLKSSVRGGFRLGGSPGELKRSGAQNRAQEWFFAFLRARRILIGMSDSLPGGAGPTPVPRPGSPEDRLDSWKEIATYLDRSIRTVQQWERKREITCPPAAAFQVWISFMRSDRKSTDGGRNARWRRN